ncbi:MAG: dihydrodipicolinate synthase family protein [Lautropia sp.]
MTRLIDANANGVYVIAPTPFGRDGSLDLDSARRMCDFYLAHGATGITILGIMGEAPKLSMQESIDFVEAVAERIAGRMPIIVGVTSPGLDQMQALARASAERGAAGVMVAPIPGLRTDDAIRRYYDQVIARLGDQPVCLQDYPQTLGVWFSVDCLLQIFAAHPSICMFKHEDSPGLAKLTAFRTRTQAELGRRVSILVGNGAMHYPQELARGADGAMTGFAFPEMLRRVYDLYVEGAADEAETIFDAYLPMVRHELQPGLGLAIRKWALARRGAITCDALRAPGPTLSAKDIEEVEHLWRRLDRRLAQLKAEGVRVP